ncbi:MAG: AbrB/MazE/SpoVT family DNA-binding domain-containing protein [Planctomycetaceae bacterium]|jgi:antitoxin component of MazEF toxin-antitoxin module|nr:AbrB/MazE/SpoVT family DNA-binding domain-containing protein [Planctomycetaceae bacterium]
MQTVIVKWGNSREICLPKDFLQNINLSENETVDVIVQHDAIIIKKLNQKKHRTTKERLRDFYGEQYEQKLTAQNEIDWGTPTGNEIW